MADCFVHVKELESSIQNGEITWQADGLAASQEHSHFVELVMDPVVILLPCRQSMFIQSHKPEWIQTKRLTEWSRYFISRFRPNVKDASFLFIGEL